MLFVAAILYDLAVVGAMNVLPLFLLREPLSWNAVEIGHGNAAGYVIFITSFLGVFVFSQYLRDITMIMIGVASFSAGILIMAFVRWTFLFYIGESNSDTHEQVHLEKGAGVFRHQEKGFCSASLRVSEQGAWQTITRAIPQEASLSFPCPHISLCILTLSTLQYLLLPRLSLRLVDL